VTRSGTQTVFAGSEATDSEGKAAAGDRSTGDAASPDTRSATGNLWSGFVPETSSSLSAADSSAAPQSGSSSLTISMALLGLGLTGILGGFLVAAVRRQRVQAGQSSGRNEL
jgi:hypothetical protein